MNEPLTIVPPGFLSFLNFPVATDLNALQADVAILAAPNGTPYAATGPYVDSADAPAAIRAESIKSSEALDHYDFDLGGPLLDGRAVRVVDCGDVRSDPLDVAGTCGRITEATAAILRAGALPILLGGDDSVPIPFFRAFQDHPAVSEPITLVQIDSHIDWRDEVKGVREGYSSTMRRASEMPWIGPMFQIGMRGVGSARPQEVADARAYGSTLIPARELHREGVERILRRVPDGGPYIVTIDCDGIDPSVMPAVNAPVPGGLSFHQVADILQGLARKGRVIGFDIVELAPRFDVNGLSANAAGRLVLNLIGALARSGQLGG